MKYQSTGKLEGDKCRTRASPSKPNASFKKAQLKGEDSDDDLSIAFDDDDDHNVMPCSKKTK